MSIKGSYRTPSWTEVQRKEKGTLFGFMISYEKCWMEVRVSTSGDNERWLSFLPEQGGEPTEELSLLGATCSAKPNKKHPSGYCEVTFAPKGRTVKLLLASDEDVAHFLKAVTEACPGFSIVR